MSTLLRVCTFKGLQNLPLYVAQQQGFFTQHGLEVELLYTAGSQMQLAGLAQGEYDLVQTAPDNVVHVNSNPAAFLLDAETMPRILMILGGSNGPLSLYAQPAVSSFQDLYRAMLGIDNPTSGYALVLRDMLARSGLVLERDYSFVVAGGTSVRLNALRKKDVAATILYAPFDQIATEEGFKRLACSTNYYSAYASLATAAAQPWLDAHGDDGISYITAFLQALHWIYDPSNATRIQEIMEGEPSLGLHASPAKHAYAAFVHSATGFGRDALLDDVGLQQVIALRATYGQQARPLGSIEAYRDMRWYEQAQSSFR